MRREEAQISPGADHIEEFYALNMALEQKLLKMPYEDETLTPERNAIRLCIYFVSRPNITLTSPTFPFASSIAQQLKSSLQESILSSAWGPCPDLLLWVLVIAGHAAYEQDEWPWIVDQAASLIEAMEIGSLEELEECLFGYLMPARPIIGLVQRLWGQVESIRARMTAEE